MANIEAVRERKQRLITSNRKARFEYEVVSTLECGIVLTGTEVKSLRTGRCSLQDSYAAIEVNELIIYNMHINEYEHGNRQNHIPKRDRKLLVHERELNKLRNAVNEKSMTLVPLSIYFSGHLVKVELALVRAKRKYDKRETTKKRETEREIRRSFKR
ncbi:MAG: SsrA-binding protein SmpB [Desulfobulbaceae bacterium]|nr:SsrA-binding protein SmpB [Desulfobulbaceae bacterium]MBS4001315.1 SsrA-binding protein SmpB [Desulfobulbaceae bacterium]